MRNEIFCISCHKCFDFSYIETVRWLSSRAHRTRVQFPLRALCKHLTAGLGSLSKMK